MIISIGILAWNESESITGTINSLMNQSLFQEITTKKDLKIEVIAVPNGCTDNTAEKAGEALKQRAETLPENVFSWSVEVLSEPGKINAWNQFIHGFSNSEADYIILADADIIIDRPDTLKNMVSELERNKNAAVAVDMPRKHTEDKRNKTLSDRISLMLSGITRASPGQLTGQLYCARGPLLRQVHIPKGIIVEDGFIKQMVCTELMRKPCDNNLIIRAPEASHVFEAYTGIKDIFLNQRRQQIGHTVYTYLRDYLIQHIGEKDAGQIIAENNSSNPEWFRELIKQRVCQSRWWVMYPGAFSVRWRRLKNLSIMRRILAIPVATAAFLLDIAVLTAANQTLRKGQLASAWQDTKSSKLD